MVDVGGGNGTTLRNLVKAYPWIKGINFDQPHVVSSAPKCDGIENVGGDMFDCVPKADAIILKVSILCLRNYLSLIVNKKCIFGKSFDCFCFLLMCQSVLHDWGDEESIRILKKCKKLFHRIKEK